MNETELAWAAGLFDGEGCTTLIPNRRQVARLRLCVKQAIDGPPRQPPEVLVRFEAVVRRGKIGGPYEQRAGPSDPPGRLRKTHFLWYAEDDRAVAAFELLRPYLSGPKRGQAERVIEAWGMLRAKRSA